MFYVKVGMTYYLHIDNHDKTKTPEIKILNSLVVVFNGDTKTVETIGVWQRDICIPLKEEAYNCWVSIATRKMKWSGLQKMFRVSE